MNISITAKQIGRFLKEYAVMALGMFCYSFGWMGCIVPADGTGGGATGLSLVLSHFTKLWFDVNISMGTYVFIVNAILLLISGFFVGWKFGIKTIYCIVVLSLAMNFWEWAGAGEILHLDRLLSIILGGILSGLGVAVCLLQGGSTGGVDIVAMIINQFRTISYGRILIVCDSLIIGLSYFIDHDISILIYGFVVTAVVGYTADMVLAGNQQSKQIFIITPDYEKMADGIVKNVHRGVTLIDSMGWYTKRSSKIVMVVCRKTEMSYLLKYVRSVDPNAFITVGSVMGVYGQGFDALNKV